MLPGKPEKEITKRAVILCERIWNGGEPGQFITYYLEYLCLHLPEPRLEPALEWIMKRGLRGRLFAEFVKKDCGSSGLELIRQITKGIEKDRGLRIITRADIA